MFYNKLFLIKYVINIWELNVIILLILLILCLLYKVKKNIIKCYI